MQGTDQEQPFKTYYGAPLQTAVQNGTIPKSVLNTMVQRVLTEMFRFKLFSQPRTGSTSATVTTPAHVALATQVAESGTGPRGRGAGGAERHLGGARDGHRRRLAARGGSERHGVGLRPANSPMTGEVAGRCRG